MSWLRLDDATRQHPKLLLLNQKQRWIWLEMLLFSAQYRTHGKVPKTIRKAIPNATKRLLDRLVEVGLFEEAEDGWIVHDWEDYNPPEPLTNAERQRRYRNAHRNAERNAGDNGDVTGDNAASRVPASAPVPVPSPLTNKGVTLGLTSRAEARAVACPNCGAQPGTYCVGVGVSQRESCHAERHAAAIALGAPRLPPPSGGSDAAPRAKTPDDAWRVAVAWVASPAFDAETMSDTDAAEELGVIERRMHVEVSEAQRKHILQLAREKHDAAIASWEGDEP